MSRLRSLEYKGKPDFVNAEGVKWWYVTSGNGYQLFLTEQRDKTREYVGLVDGEAVSGGTAIDAVASKAERVALGKRMF